MAAIRVLIADDHVIVRDGVRLILEAQPDMEVVGEASDGREAVEKARALAPDVVVMDIAMPGMSGLEATAVIKKELPPVQVVVLTMHEDYQYFFEVQTSLRSSTRSRAATCSRCSADIRSPRWRCWESCSNRSAAATESACSFCESIPMEWCAAKSR